MGSATRHCRQGRCRRGVEGVRSPHFLKPRGMTPQKFGYFSIFFLEAYKFKVAAIRSETKFLGYVGLGAYESVPLSKLRGSSLTVACRCTY